MSPIGFRTIVPDHLPPPSQKKLREPSSMLNSTLKWYTVYVNRSNSINKNLEILNSYLYQADRRTFKLSKSVVLDGKGRKKSLGNFWKLQQQGAATVLKRRHCTRIVPVPRSWSCLRLKSKYVHKLKLEILRIQRILRFAFYYFPTILFMKYQFSIFDKKKPYKRSNFRLKSKIFHDPGSRKQQSQWFLLIITEQLT